MAARSKSPIWPDPISFQLIDSASSRIARLRLMKMPSLFGGSVPAVAETNQPRWGNEPGAIAVFKLGASFWMSSRFRKVYNITHEIGHCLGLNHRDEASSVMSYAFKSNYPDEHDRDSLDRYYLGVGT